MKIIGERLRTLREGVKLSQTKLGEMVGTSQANIGRYETDVCTPPAETFLWYADYFDVSLDWIYGRCDKPQGKLYNYQPETLKEKMANNEEIRQFVEMCFDPQSSINERLKETLTKMLQEGKNNEQRK